jgi:excisionase family DNA binding protein
VIHKGKSNQDCTICLKLLSSMQRFIDMFGNVHRALVSDWLTVDEVAKELKISKSIVYRLIHNGEIEAIDIVDSNSRIPQKGHYRIQRKNLNEYLERKTVKLLPDSQSHQTHLRHFPKVKNHLGL